MSEPPVDDLQEALDAFLNGETGVPFEALALFAEPLFDLYEVELRAPLSEARATRDAEELASLLAVLETARLLWAYFLLDAAERRAHAYTLEAHLLGPDALGEDSTQFRQLLHALEEYWTNVTRRAEETEVPGYALPPFEVLLSQYAAAVPATRYGPDALDLPEALALFTQEVIDASDAHDDPDALDAAMERAHDYWELAHTPAPAFEEYLDEIKTAYGGTRAGKERIEREARRMVARFYELFPEHRP